MSNWVDGKASVLYLSKHNINVLSCHISRCCNYESLQHRNYILLEIPVTCIYYHATVMTGHSDGYKVDDCLCLISH